MGATVLLKWTKTLQNRREVRTIVIPDLGDSPLCPCTLLKTMLSAIPGDTNAPLFSIIQTGKLVTLTDSMARKHLKILASRLWFPHFTFHMFRKGGTTWAFQYGVSLQDIMAHGLPRPCGDTSKLSPRLLSQLPTLIVHYYTPSLAAWWLL